jgi:hypothetical protein
VLPASRPERQEKLRTIPARYSKGSRTGAAAVSPSGFRFEASLSSPRSNRCRTTPAKRTPPFLRMAAICLGGQVRPDTQPTRRRALGRSDGTKSRNSGCPPERSQRGQGLRAQASSYARRIRTALAEAATSRDRSCSCSAPWTRQPRLPAQKGTFEIFLQMVVCAPSPFTHKVSAPGNILVET